MKITKLLLTLIVTCMVLASCNKSSDKLVQAIPANAMYVVNVNTQSLIDKSAYNVFDNITAKRGISMAQAMLSNKEAMDMFNAFVKDVNSIGLDIKGDTYMYTDYNLAGVVMGVNNADKIKDALVHFGRMDAESIKKDQAGIYSLTLDRDVVVCWDDNKLLLLGNIEFYRYYYGDDKKAPNLMEIAKKQLTQSVDESILSNSAFATFLDEKKDISLFYSYSNFDFLEKMSGVEIPENIKTELDQLKGVSPLTFISFEKGEIKATSKICYANSGVEKKYKELAQQVTGDLRGEQLKYIQDNPLFFITASLKGSGIYEYLGKLGLTERLEKEFAYAETGVDLKTIFNYFNGDITFSFGSIQKVMKSYSWGDKTHEYESTEPILTALADVSNAKEVLKLIVDQMDEEELSKIDDNTYIRKDNGISSYLGIKDNFIFFSNDSVFFQNLKSENLKSKYSELAKNKAMVIGGNLDNIKEYLIDEIRDDKVGPLVLEGLNLLGDYSFTTSKELTGEGKIVITDNSKNSLAVICQYFDKVLTTANDNF